MHPQSLIDSLLFEEEGTELDFKRDQYPFDGADDEQKSELLKDVLAFVNAWRRADAYILIGIQEVKGGESVVFGVSTHLDDAKLQQFVNSKTNKPIEFSYTPMTFRSEQIGLIHIPLQDRPVYLTREYGNLRKETVYIRRGSSTGTAKPDEVAKMGAAVDERTRLRPQLLPMIAAGDDWSEIATNATFESIELVTPPLKDLPDYDPPSEYGPFGMPRLSPMYHTNRAFFREQAEYLRFTNKMRPVRLSVRNTGTALASGVKVIVQIDDPEGTVEVALGCDKPARATRQWSPMDNLRAAPVAAASDIDVVRTKLGWTITSHLGKVHAKDTALSDEELLVGVTTTRSLRLLVSVFADELSSPVQEALSIDFFVRSHEMTYEQLTR
jgi:hypothetical protein